MKDALYTVITDLDDYEFYKVDRELIKKFAYSKDWKKAGIFMPYQFSVVVSDNYYLYKPDLITYDESTDTFSPSIENKKLKFGITDVGQYFKSIVDLNMGTYMCPTVCRTFKDVDEIKDFCKTYNGTFIEGYSESEVKKVHLTAELKKLKKQVKDLENKLKDL